MATGATNILKKTLLDYIDGKTFKMVLMQPGFTFNKDTHNAYANVSASECASAYGYTTGGLAMTVTSGGATQDNTADRGILPFDNMSLTPSGANILTCGAFIYDQTDDLLCAYLDGGGTVTLTDGQPYSWTDISVYIG